MPRKAEELIDEMDALLKELEEEVAKRRTSAEELLQKLRQAEVWKEEAEAKAEAAEAREREADK
jgi:phage shock protein A